MQVQDVIAQKDEQIAKLAERLAALEAKVRV